MSRLRTSLSVLLMGIDPPARMHATQRSARMHARHAATWHSIQAMPTYWIQVAALR